MVQSYNKISGSRPLGSETVFYHPVIYSSLVTLFNQQSNIVVKGVWKIYHIVL